MGGAFCRYTTLFEFIIALSHAYSAQAQGTAPWLKCIFFGKWAITRLSNEAYIANLRMRLLLTVTDEVPDQKCTCMFQVGDRTRPYHALICKDIAKQIDDKHNAVNAVLTEACEQIRSVKVIDNPLLRRLNNDPAGTVQPDLTYIVDDITYFIDVTIREPSCDSRRGETVAQYLEEAERSKHRKYNHRIPDNAVFVPFACDTVGNFAKSAIALIDSLAPLVKDPKEFKSSVFRKISVTMAVHNALSIVRFKEFQLLHRFRGSSTG